MEDQHVDSKCSSVRTMCNSFNTDVGLQPGPWRDLRPRKHLHGIRDNRQYPTYEEIDASIRLSRPRSRSGDRLETEWSRSRKRRQGRERRTSESGARNDDGPGDAAIEAESLDGMSPRSTLAESGSNTYLPSAKKHGSRRGARLDGEGSTSRRRRQRSGGRISQRGTTDDDEPGDAAIEAESLDGMSPRSTLAETGSYVSSAKHGLWIGDRLLADGSSKVKETLTAVRMANITGWCEERRRTGRRRHRSRVTRWNVA